MPDHALQPLEIARLLVATFALFAAPGLAWTAVFWRPGTDLGRYERLGTICLLSYGIAGGTALVLARVHAFTPATYAVALGGLIVLGAVLSLRRLRTGPWAGFTVSRTRALVAIGGLLALGFLVVAPQIGMVFPAGYPVGTITWYYWGLALRMLETGTIPATSPEWGGSYPFQGDYILYTAFSAGLAQLAGRSSEFALMEILRLGSLLWGFAAALAALRRFLPTGAALLGTLLFFTATHVFLKYTGYRPEAFHYFLIFSGLWAADRLAERPSVSRAVPVVAIFVMLWIGHGVVLVISGLLAIGVILSRWIFERPTLRQVAFVAAVPVAGVICSSLVDLLLQGGVLLFQNAVDPGRIQGPFASDLTWQFRQWLLGGRLLLDGDPSDAENLLTQRVFLPWPVLDLEDPPLALVAVLLLGLVSLPFLTWPWLGRAARRLHVASYIYLAGLIGVVYMFLTLYDTYVPQRVGFGRLAPFTLVAATIWLAVGATGVVNAVSEALAWWRARRPSRVPLPRSANAWRAVGWAAMITTAVLIGAGPSIQASRGVLDTSKLSADGHEALVWIRDHTPRDSVVLANAYTEGSIYAISGRNGLLDGRAPYNKEFAFLRESVELLQLGRSFYGGETSVSDMAALGVDVVILAPQPHDIANAHSFCEEDLGDVPPCVDLSRDPGLAELARFGHVVVYGVRSSLAAQTSASVSASECSGCQPVSSRSAVVSPRISGASSGRTSSGSTTTRGRIPAS
jgi:hypothetical protein